MPKMMKPPRLYPANMSRVEMNLANAIDAIVSVPIISGNYFVGIKLTASKPLAVQHQLGHLPRGWIISDVTEYATIKRTEWSITTLTLEADADCIVSIIVF